MPFEHIGPHVRNASGCPNTPYRCGNPGCGTVFLRKDKGEHFCSCQHRLTPCEVCKETMAQLRDQVAQQQQTIERQEQANASAEQRIAELERILDHQQQFTQEYADDLRDSRGLIARLQAERQAAQAPPPHPCVNFIALGRMTDQQQKNYLGEKLFTRIQRMHPHHAAILTGMLLEMENCDIIRVLESQQLLHEKVQEAVQVVREHGGVDI
eukprot:TRINITY_DN5480_c0_g1_i4.p1 TRINITY_DN5480_c0_g1~~TRINITY_DN5480_c0_g1_i4.p1  ORF type:complete len:235 (+),score=88.57 TRINITY_DN5480_c0_g1_i4:74-706(+)